MTPKEREYATRLSLHLKVELKRQGMQYKELARRLTEQGIQESSGSIASKLARGTFSAVFLAATLAILGQDFL